MTDRRLRILVAGTRVAGLGALWAGLRHEHRPDRDGRCTACRPRRGVRQPWPCRARQLADRAWPYTPERGSVSERSATSNQRWG